MIPFYTICWRNFQITVDSLESVLETASQPLEITVVNPYDDLPNSGTPKIREHLREQVANGRIKRALFFNVNACGWSLMKALEDFTPKGDLFFLTDGDLILPKGVDWIKLSQDYHARGWAFTGCNLSLENYLPPCHGFDSNQEEFGLWLTSSSPDWFLKHHGVHQNSIDSRLMDIARHTGGATKIREIEAYHTTWSIHDPNSKYYDPEYAAYKRQVASNFAFCDRPVDMSYELVTK